MADHRRTISPLPMSEYMPSRWKRKHIMKDRERALALAQGESLVSVPPLEQTSKGRNIRRKNYKRDKRHAQGIS